MEAGGIKSREMGRKTDRQTDRHVVNKQGHGRTGLRSYEWMEWWMTRKQTEEQGRTDVWDEWMDGWMDGCND